MTNIADLNALIQKADEWVAGYLASQSSETIRRAGAKPVRDLLAYLSALTAATPPSEALAKLERYSGTEIENMLRRLTKNGEIRDYDDEIANRIEDAADLCAAVRAFLSSQAPRPAPISTHGDGWRPIETAPTDGTPFLAVTGNWRTVCSWNKHRHDWCVSSPSYESYPVDERPTHWMPLPSPPTAAPQKEPGE